MSLIGDHTKRIQISCALYILNDGRILIIEVKKVLKVSFLCSIIFYFDVSYELNILDDGTKKKENTFFSTLVLFLLTRSYILFPDVGSRY